MIIFPAIDIIGGKAVRLFKGEYDKKTEYGDPVYFANDFKNAGATHVHVVDLDGAKSGETFNFDTVKNIKSESGLFVEIGGGVRDFDRIEKYLNCGVDRVILGTAAVNGDFLSKAVANFGDKIAVGADVKDGFIAVKGWTESSGFTLDEFLTMVMGAGAKTVICTDVSLDGAMKGTNIKLYEEIVAKYKLNIVASGGVSSLEEVKKLKTAGVYGAIIGKAYYTGAIDLQSAIRVAK